MRAGRTALVFLACGTGVALLCHGYGTVVCGRAAAKREPPPDVTDAAVRPK